MYSARWSRPNRSPRSPLVPPPPPAARSCRAGCSAASVSWLFQSSNMAARAASGKVQPPSRWAGRRRAATGPAARWRDGDQAADAISKPARRRRPQQGAPCMAPYWGLGEIERSRIRHWVGILLFGATGMECRAVAFAARVHSAAGVRFRSRCGDVIRVWRHVVLTVGSGRLADAQLCCCRHPPTAADAVGPRPPPGHPPLHRCSYLLLLCAGRAWRMLLCCPGRPPAAAAWQHTASLLHAGPHWWCGLGPPLQVPQTSRR